MGHWLEACPLGGSLGECSCGMVAQWDGTGWWCARGERLVRRRYGAGRLPERSGKCARPVVRDGDPAQCGRKRGYGLHGEFCRQHEPHSWETAADLLKSAGHRCEPG